MEMQFIQILRSHADPEVKQWFEGYCKGQEQFLGLKTPLVESLLKDFLRDISPISSRQYFDFAEALLWQPYTESCLAGMIVLQKYLISTHERQKRQERQEQKISAEQILDLAERLFCKGRIQWWNTCDWLCIRVLSRLIGRDGPSVGRHISNWKDSELLWQGRAALIPFVTHAKNPVYLDDILCAARHLVRSPERFHQTAVGWVMREVGKSNEPVLTDFLQRELVHFSAEGLRYATEKLPRDVVLEFRRQRKAAKS